MLEEVKRKSLTIRESGRSTDFISPSFGYGCLYNCTYCYMKRHKPEGLDVAKNTVDILNAINIHSWLADVEKPNQTHERFITYDISCNEDFALHAKYHDWRRIFDFFKQHPTAMASFATKYVNKDLLDYKAENEDYEKKIRIRFSLMPQDYSTLLEPNTSTIQERLEAIEPFYEAGYEVHLNFSPVIVYPGWLDKYRDLFTLVNHYVGDAYYNDDVKAEVIFLTHNENKHRYNVMNKLPGEDLLWQPHMQEEKTSQYGGKNIRYEHNLKRQFIEQFIELHDQIIPWNTIRYIF
jgi:spore photoproduct lyase